jgi:uncharacterized protein YycO
MILLQQIRLFGLRLVRPIIKFIDGFHLPHTNIDDDAFEILLRDLQDGDILLSRNNWNLTNLTIPGFWKHAAIYCQGYAIEAVGDGVRKEHFAKWLFTKDHVIVLRPTFCHELVRSAAGVVAASMIGKPYDLDFSPGVEAFYCSELVYWSYDEAMGNESPFKPRTIMGVETIAPDDFVRARSKFQIIFMHKGR